MKRTAIWIVFAAIWIWMLFDGGAGRIIAIVSLAAIAIGGLAVYITKKIIGSNSQ